jgi:hypothetical protein
MSEGSGHSVDLSDESINHEVPYALALMIRSIHAAEYSQNSSYLSIKRAHSSPTLSTEVLTFTLHLSYLTSPVSQNTTSVFKEGTD